MNDTPSPPDNAAERNDGADLSPSRKDKKKEMVAAMHELSSALLDLGERLRTLSDATSGAGAAPENVASEPGAPPEQARSSELPPCQGQQQKPDGDLSRRLPTTSRYQAVGRPFGPGAAARGIWRLFKQNTTRN